MMYKKIFQLSAVASVVVASMATAQAATETVEVTSWSNLFHTGQMPNDPSQTQMGAGGEMPDDNADYYKGYRMALNGYPNYTPEKCKISLHPEWYDETNALKTDTATVTAHGEFTDDEQKCFGTVPEVIDLSVYTGAVTISVDAAKTVNGFDAKGDPNTDDANSLAKGAVIGMWVSDDYAAGGSTVGLDDNSNDNEAPGWWDDTGNFNSYNGISLTDGGFNSLQAYADATPDNSAGDLLDGAVGEGNLNDNAKVQGWRTNFPGFIEIANEFAVFDGASTVGSNFEVSLTPPDGATHLILAYSQAANSFGNINSPIAPASATAADKFTITVADSTSIIADFTAATVTVNGTAATAANGAYDVEVDDSVVIAANATATGVTAITAGSYSWTVDSTANAETEGTLTLQFTEADTAVPVMVTIADTANNVTGSQTFTFNVSAEAVATSASFTKSASSVTEGTEVTFMGSATPATGETIASWAWDFKDGSTSTEQNPSHTFNTAGEYAVSLTVTDSAGGTSAAATQTVTVTAATDPEPTDPAPTTGGGGGGSLSWFIGLGLLAPAFIRRRFKK